MAIFCFSFGSCATGGVLYMHAYIQGGFILCLGFRMLITIKFVWRRDSIWESKFEGHHTGIVQGLRYGVIFL